MGSKASLAVERARVVAATPSGSDLTLVEIELEAPIRETYARPGQYIELAVGAQCGYFALAGDVGAATWQLLVGRSGGAALALRSAGHGLDVEVSRALGGGFPEEPARHEALIVVATGSGVAAIRPLLRQRIADGMAAETHAYIGVRTWPDVPLPLEIEAWRQAGMNVTVCLSREPRPSHPGTFAGYVQHAVAHRHGRAGVPLTEVTPTAMVPTRVFAVGAPAMLEQLRELVPALGIREEDIHTNY